MNINPGEFNKKIDFYIKAGGVDTDGFRLKADTFYYSCAAKFSRTSGTEIAKSGADFSSVNVRFLIRFSRSKTINRKMIVKYNSEWYEIKYTNDYEDKHEYIEVFATKIEAR